MESLGTISRSLETLALAPGASLFDAKRAYRSLAKTWHPDRFIFRDDGRHHDAEEKMKEINEAYHTIVSHYPQARTHDHQQQQDPFQRETQGTATESVSSYMRIQAQIRAKAKAEARKTFYIMSFLVVGGLAFLTVSSALIWWFLPYAMYFAYG